MSEGADGSIYVSDGNSNNRIRVVNLTTRTVSSLGVGGTVVAGACAPSAFVTVDGVWGCLNRPSYLSARTATADGGAVYFLEPNAYRFRVITPATNGVYTVAGNFSTGAWSDGLGPAARFTFNTGGMAEAASGVIFFCDT
jgi:hypothetical protein